MSTVAEAPHRPLLLLDTVRKTYATEGGEVRALAGVTLRVDPGEYVAVVGPSGSGKSTLLAVVAGLVEPDPGSRIEVCGRSWTDTTGRTRSLHRRRSLGFVHQGLNLVSFLSVAENVMLPLLLEGRRPAAARHDADQGLGRFALVDLGPRMPAHLSGGQQQRVAVARALVARQPLLLADEPTGALDTTSSRQVFATIAEHARGGGGALVVSHDPLVTEYASRVITVHDGVLSEA
ncbi:ABC transporter ATP-binding protein [Modestobacter sp. SYSU DS0290]